MVRRGGGVGAFDATFEAGSGGVGGLGGAGEESMAPEKEMRLGTRLKEVGLAGLNPWHLIGGGLSLAEVVVSGDAGAMPGTGRMGCRARSGEW